MSLVQILVPFQDAATATVDAAVGIVSSAPSSVPGDVHEKTVRDKAALEHRVAALTMRVTELEQENAILTGIRLADFDGRPIGITGRLIPARVITRDILPWRSSGLIDTGSLRGVRRGATVTSRLFAIDRGAEEGVGDGMAILLSEVFVGVVDSTGTHTARVKMLSDVSTRIRVRIGRFVEDRFVLAGPDFWLAGRGGGRMEIRDVDRRHVKSEIVRVGDVVLADPSEGLTPSALTIGKITAIDPDRKNPLLSNLTVTSPMDLDSLRRVYVYDPDDNAK